MYRQLSVGKCKVSLLVGLPTDDIARMNVRFINRFHSTLAIDIPFILHQCK